jgi:hypothetical protein
MSNLIEKEIVELENEIKSLKVKGGFCVPESYFEALQSKLDNIGEEPHLGIDLEGKIREGKTGFSIPQGYFESLENKVTARVFETKRTAKVMSIFSYKKFLIVGIAATFLFSAFLFLWKDEKMISFSENKGLEVDQVASHLEIGDLNEDLLCDAGWCDELTTLPVINEELPEGYLNDAETELIMEEL